MGNSASCRAEASLVFVQTVEAAKECGMASVVVAGRKPLYELKAADLVIKRLSELRVINLQQLFRNEELVQGNVRRFSSFSCLCKPTCMQEICSFGCRVMSPMH